MSLKRFEKTNKTPPSLLFLLSFLAAAHFTRRPVFRRWPIPSSGPTPPPPSHRAAQLTARPTSTFLPSSSPHRSSRPKPFLLTSQPNVQPAAQHLPPPFFFFFRSLPAGARMSRSPPTFRPLPCLALPRLPRMPPAVTASVPRSFHLQAINQGAFVLDFHFPSINSIRYSSIKPFSPS
jgi:hypothetical protein